MERSKTRGLSVPLLGVTLGAFHILPEISPEETGPASYRKHKHKFSPVRELPCCCFISYLLECLVFLLFLILVPAHKCEKVGGGRAGLKLFLGEWAVWGLRIQPRLFHDNSREQWPIKLQIPLEFFLVSVCIHPPPAKSTTYMQLDLYTNEELACRLSRFHLGAFCKLL